MDLVQKQAGVQESSSPPLANASELVRIRCDRIQHAYWECLLSRLDLAEACEMLVTHGADMNSRDRYGETPLLASVYFGCEMNARTLIQHGATLDLVDDK